MSVIVIRYDGTDITEHIELAEAEFVSAVNGQIGSATFVVKDAEHTHGFIAGRSLTLDIDGTRTWGGYVIQATKAYPFPVVRTTNPEDVVRLWRITGVDYNVLFNKRIVWDSSAPTTHTAFNYDANTYDDTIINDIFDNYLDIGDDGLTRTGVQRIAKAILDVPGKTHTGEVARAGFTWKETMDSISRATGGVYCINPDKVLMYVDVETVTSDYTLSDTPSAAIDVGYQNFELLENGSNMVNDMLFWGIVPGPSGYVFSRTTDATSIADHFRWQFGAQGSIWRQASADIVADSYVYGTPQSHRGGKDDAISISCRVFHPLFQVGQVVSILSDIFGYSDNLPLRRMTTTFPSPTIAVFDLWLSHEIDQPNAINEYWYPPFPKYKPPRVVTPGPPVVCYTFDDFNRTVALIGQDSWGSASSGPTWTWSGTGGLVYVDGEAGVIAADTGDGGGEMYVVTGLGDSADFTAEISFYTTGGGQSTSVWYTFASLRVGFLAYDPVTFGYPYPGTRDPATIFIDDGLGGFAEADMPSLFFENLTANYAILKIQRVSGVVSAKAWDPASTPEPDWMVTGTLATGDLTVEMVHATLRAQEQGGGELKTDYIKFCSNSDVPQTALLGKVLETLLHSGGSTFSTTRSYQSGTLEVSVNGTRQTPLTTEGSSGSFSLSEPIATTDVLQVSYVAQGPTGKFVTYSPGITKEVLDAALADETLDTIYLNAGTYTLGQLHGANRSRQVHVQALGTVVFSPDSTQDAFEFGYDGRSAANIWLDGITFDGYALGPVGVINVGNAHNITLTNITVQNCTGEGDTSWALYVSEDSGFGAFDIIADNWTVIGNVSRDHGALQLYHSPGVTTAFFRNWVVSGVNYAIYANPDPVGATTVTIDNWNVTDSGIAGLSVLIANTQGTISNVVASGGHSISSPMVEGSGNVWT